MIKSIVVKRKPFELKVGETVWINFFSPIEYTITSEIQLVDHIYYFTAARNDGRFGIMEKEFPGDLGMPGYAYDDRPCVIFKNKMAAEAASGKYNRWLTNNRDSRHNSALLHADY